MALFQNEELVDVTTPDGRTVKLPASLANGLQLPAPVPTPVVPTMIGAAPAGIADETVYDVKGEQAQPNSVTGGALPTVEDQIPDVVPQQQADYVQAPMNVPQEKRQRAAQVRQEAAAAKQAAAYAASPKGQMAKADAQMQDAIANEGEALTSSADVDAAGLMMTADVYKKRNEDIIKREAKRAADADEDLRQQNAKLAQMEGARKKIAGSKIDRKLDHPVLAAIGAALIGIGQGMKGEKVQTLDILLNMIDRKAAAQLEALDQQKTVYGMMKDEMSALKEKASSRLALNNLLVAGETEKAIRHIEEITARTSSQKVKANAAVLIAQLQQRAAEKTMDATKYQLDYDQRDRAEAGQNRRHGASLAQADRHHKDDMQLKREEMYLDAQKALAAERARSGELAMKQMFEMQKDNELRGIRNTSTNEALLTPEGRKMMDEAAKLVAEADKIDALAKKDPMGQSVSGATLRASMLREKASQLRGEAEIRHMVRHRDPTQAGKLANQYSTVQNMASTIDDIKMLYDKPGEGGKSYVYTSAGQQEIQAKTVEVLMGLKNAWQLGVLSKQDAALIEKAMGGSNPIDGWTVGNIASLVDVQLGKDPEGFKRALDSVVAGAQNQVFLELKGTNFSGTKDDLFYRKTAPETTPEGQAAKNFKKEQTPLEREGFAREQGEGVLGTVRSGVQGAFYSTTPGREAEAAANSGSLKYQGLSPGQEKEYDNLLKSYQSGNGRAGELLVQQALSDRPEVAIAVMGALAETAPELYTRARGQLKNPEVVSVIDSKEKSTIGTSMVATPMLVQQYATDPENEDLRKEIAKRAAAGDKIAAKAALEISQSRGLEKAKKNLPAGSVFREGR